MQTAHELTFYYLFKKDRTEDFDNLTEKFILQTLQKYIHVSLIGDQCTKSILPAKAT